MKNILFVGNGLNLLSSNLTWGKLLKDIYEECCEKYGLLIDKFQMFDDVPNTLQYEYIFLSLKDKCNKNIFQNLSSVDTDIQFELKNMIAEKMIHFKGNSIYDELVKMNFEHYITTNYDLVLDNVLSKNGWEAIEGNSTEKIYNIRRCRTYQRNNLIKHIYPIHGDIKSPKSIMIDYNHYCGTIAKINDYLKGEYEWDKKYSEKLKSIEERIENGSICDIHSWIDYFFTSNIYIVGFGFDWSEIELWWLLNRRKRISTEIKNMPNIYFYNLTSDERKEKNTSICTMLESLGIICRDVKVEKSNYLNAYKSIITFLKNDLYSNKSKNIK